VRRACSASSCPLSRSTPCRTAGRAARRRWRRPVRSRPSRRHLLHREPDLGAPLRPDRRTLARHGKRNSRGVIDQHFATSPRLQRLARGSSRT
jgi:hypothetical protein